MLGRTRLGVIPLGDGGEARVRAFLMALSTVLETEIDLHQVPDPLADENLLKTSGRGIFLMRTFMDEFEVHRSPQGGAELVMAKKLVQRPAISSDRASSRTPKSPNEEPEIVEYRPTRPDG